MTTMPILDADGHVTESNEGVAKILGDNTRRLYNF